MKIHDFIKKRKYLIWYVKDYDRLNNELELSGWVGRLQHKITKIKNPDIKN